jgi:DUF4097 and DUF4098 domain-containing protein YvlB
MNPVHPMLLAGLLLGLSTADTAVAEEEAGDLLWPTDSDVRIEIEVVSGSIEIEGWDRDEVRVRVEGGRTEALDIKATRKRVVIRSPNFHRKSFFGIGGDLDVDISVSVPARSRIEAKSTNGAIRAEGVSGNLDINAANGDIDVRGSPSEARLETINASIDFEGRESRVEARTINGSIELAGVAQEVSASTISGSIRVEASTLERVELKTLSGSIELATRLAANARAHLKSFSGSIELELPSDTSARFDVQCFSGGIRNDLATTRTSASRTDARHLEFTTAEGDGRVRIESFSGGVEIRSAD